MGAFKKTGMEKKVLIMRGYYLCSCTKEFLTDDVPKRCGICKYNLSRVTEFWAIRHIKQDGEYEIIIYPECGIH